MRAPLAGVQVVELGQSPAIGYAGKLLTDMGADVVKVEPPSGDIARHLGPYRADVPDIEGSGLFAYLNAGKRSAVHDIATASGTSAIHALLRGAEVVFLGADDPMLEPHGFSAATLAAKYSRSAIIRVAASAPIPAQDLVAVDDLTIQAASAISIGTGLRGRPPLKLPGDQSAYQSGLCAAIAAMSAVLARTGALIDLAALDIWASLYNGGEVANDFFGRKRRPRAGYRVSRQPFLRAIFACKDGYFAIQCTETRHWLAFLRMVEREDLARHPLFTDRLRSDDEYAEQCNAFFQAWFEARTKEDLLRLCLDAKIPAAPVYNFEEVTEHRHLAHRAFFREVEMQGRALTVPGHPFGESFAYAGPKRVPRLGEATDAQWPAPSQGSTAPAGDPSQPLRGIRVVDFGWVWAGAIPGHVLADLGAEVIRIESRKPLDFMRQGTPIVGNEKDPEQNPVFQNVNRGKLSLCIDLTQAGASEVVKELVATSDIVIENFSPGVMARFGLAWSQLRSVKSDLIMCSMSAAGQSGPLRGIRTYASMIAALAGMSSMAGYPGEKVLGVQAPPYADPNAGLHATFAILSALHGRRLHGDGAYIDLSQWEAAVNVMGAQVLDYAMNGRVPGTCGTRELPYAPSGNYPVSGEEQWIAISVRADEQWHGLQQALGMPPWMSDPKYADRAGRVAHAGVIERALATETRRYAGQELAAGLRRVGVPAQSLLDIQDILNHPYFKARDLFQMVGHPKLKQVPVYRLPWKVNGSAIPVRRRAPMLGEHTEHVLHAILGKTAQDVAALRRKGIVD
ncbi:MAG: CoA transferase [Burkholderiales bacterium]|nr:CoA transferase [Burkholderiales bacterium]